MFVGQKLIIQKPVINYCKCWMTIHLNVNHSRH